MTTIIKTIGKNGTDGTDGKPGVDGTNITRVVYQDGKDGEAGTTTHTFATLDDGLKFGANAAVKKNGANPVSNKLNSTIDIVGTTAKADHEYSADNLTTTVDQDENGKTTITVLMDKDIKGNSLTVGEKGEKGSDGKPGKDGVDGKIGVNGKDGSAVVINGKDGSIGLNGKDGANGLTIKGANGAVGVDGTDGKNGKDGMTRIVYQDANQTDHTVATLDDGLKFKGDSGDVVTRKLNTQLDVTGGQTEKDKLTTLMDKNIGVVSDDKDGKLEILLNKDLTGLNSTTYTTKNGDKTYTTTINGGGLTIKEGDTDQNPISITKNNITMGGQQVHNVAAGTGDYDAVNMSQLNAITIHDYSVNSTTPETDTNYGNKGATGKNALAAGVSAKASRENGTAVGTGTDAWGTRATAVGSYVNVSGESSVALGTSETQIYNGKPYEVGTNVSGNRSVGIGVAANTSGNSAVAIGDGANSAGLESIALGKSAVASTDNDIAFGSNARSSGTNAIAIGASSGEPGEAGYIAGANSSGNYSVAIGTGANTADTASIAIGRSSRSSNSATAIGDGALASGLNSLAIGRTTTSNGMTRTTQSMGSDSMAFGNGANAWGNGSIAFGKLANAGEDSSTGVGNAVAIGNEANAWNENAVALGYKSGAAKNSIAVGTSSSAWKENAMALGNSAIGAVEYGIALGEGATVTNRYKQNQWGNWVEDTDNPATGAVAIGNSSLANVEGGVALGKGSKAVTAKSDVAGYDVVTGTAFAGTTDTPVTSSVWHSTSGAVSVGDAAGDLTRRITSVAAGTEDTDAVNVAQLKRVKAAMDSVAGAHTEVTVNDKSNPTIAKVGEGQYDDYAGEETDNLHIAAMKGTDGKLTYNIKLNDQLSIGKNGKDGTDGKVTVETKGGTTVIIGHDGENGKDGKDGLFVRGDDGKDGKSGTSITGPNGLSGKDGIDGTIGIAGKDGKDAVSLSGKDGVGHIGLTGPKGADGKDGTSIDLSTDYRTKTLNPDKNTTVNGEEKASRIIYSDAKGEHEVATMDDGQKYHGDFGDVANVALNHQVNIVGDISSYNAKNPESKVDKGALTDGATNVGVETTKDDQGNATLTIKLNKNLTGLESVTADGAKLGKHAAGDTSLTVYEIGADGNPVAKTDDNGKAVTDKAGTYVTGLTNKTWDGKTYVSGRAATEDQLMQITSSIVNKGATGGFGLSANGSSVKQDLGKTIAINGDGTYDKDGKETKAGNISTSVENRAVKVSLNKDLNIDSTTMEKTNGDGSKVTNKTTAEGSTITKTDANGKTTASTTIHAGSLTIEEGGNKTTIGGGNATIGKVTINGNGENDGNDQHTSTIKGLSNTTFDTSHLEQYNKSDRAATEGQLKDVYDMASKHTTVTVNGKDAPSTDGNLILKKDDKNGSANYDLALNNDITLGDKDNDGKLTVQSRNSTKSITTNGEDGTLTFKDGNNTASIKAAESAKGVDGTKDIKRVAIDNHTVATMDDGMKFAGDTGKALKQKLNSTTNIKGGATGDLSDGNIGVVSDGKDTLTVKLAKDIKGLSSMEVKTINATTVNSSTFNAGNTTIDNSGVTIKTGDSGRTITIKDGGVSMGGNQIHNVAPGTAPDDAVNVSQLNATNGVVNKLGSRINKVGAGAAALAALHPLDFDPDDKWDVAAGYGHYKNADAAAIGAFYQPNEDTMLSIGGSFGGGENMVNAGISVKLGQGNHVSTSRVAMAKEIKDLRENVAKLNDVVNRQSALIDKLTGVNAGTIEDKGNDLFPDVPANHWAYEYVTALHKAGILEGYPDGTFGGDRMMTRYEFAAIVYRAIMAGAASNPALNRDGTLDKLAKEFSSEMKYIRIDTISKDRNGNPDIQRVRVIPQKQEKK